LVPIGPVVSEKKLEMWKVYRRQTTDDRCQVMAIVHLDLRPYISIEMTTATWTVQSW